MYGLQCILRVSLYCLRTPLREKGLFTTCKAAVRKRRRPCLNWQCQWPFAPDSPVVCENTVGSSVCIPLLTHAPAHYPCTSPLVEVGVVAVYGAPVGCIPVCALAAHVTAS